MAEQWGALSQWLALTEHELLLFAAIFFLIGAADELAMDTLWLWLRLSGKIHTPRIASDFREQELAGPAVVFIPTWQEAAVIGTTIRHMLTVWPHDDVRIMIGCYANDPATVHAARAAMGADRRVEIVTTAHNGPTSKADCLNQLYRHLTAQEAADGWRAHMVLLHDAEDMVDPDGLAVLSRALEQAHMAQLPVMAMPHPRSPFVSAHYADEFAEAHAKTLPVRDALGLAVPSAGVGCAVRRSALAALDEESGGEGPFNPSALTEDYELGLRLGQRGWKTRFVRMRNADGDLIATRAVFPDRLRSAIRQKARWLHGIAFQGWDRLGWQGGLSDRWMLLRDRRGPFAALVLLIGYIGAALAMLAALSGTALGSDWSPWMRSILWITLGAMAWRLIVRVAFTTHLYGPVHGLLAIPRALVSNAIAILATSRALGGYVLSLFGRKPSWDKTAHGGHPVWLREGSE